MKKDAKGDHCSIPRGGSRCESLREKDKRNQFSCNLIGGTQEVRLRKSRPDDEEGEDTLKTALEEHPRREEGIFTRDLKSTLLWHVK